MTLSGNSLDFKQAIAQLKLITAKMRNFLMHLTKSLEEVGFGYRIWEYNLLVTASSLSTFPRNGHQQPPPTLSQLQVQQKSEQGFPKAVAKIIKSHWF